MITLKDVTKQYPDGTVAVGGLSMEIASREITVLLGSSGCGKTTTLRMINRLIEPTSGTIELDGRDLATVSVHELRRGIGYVIQQAGLFPHRTVADNIATVPKLLGWDRKRSSGWSTTWPIATRASSPAASSSASAWHAPWPLTRPYC